MNTTELKQAMRLLIANDDVPFIVGKPGGGKSDTVKQFAMQMAKDLDLPYYEGPENFNSDNFGFIDLRLNSIDVIDLSGLPMIDHEREVTKFTRSPYIPASGHGILFLDELPQSKPSNMAAVSQLILDKRVGSYSLGPNWKIITAGNRTKDRASANRLPTHIANRLTTLELDFDINTFVEYMQQHNIDEAAIAFARHAPQHLESFNPDHEINCTPRSFIASSHYLTLPEDIMYPLVSGTTGEGMAAEFIGFNKLYKNLPDVQDFIDNPSKIKIPEEPDLLFATLQMLSHNANEENIPALARFVKRVEKDAPERAVNFWKEALLRDPSIFATTECQDFATANKDILV